MATTGPVIWITLPVSVGAAVAICSVPPYSRRALRGVQARQLPCLGARRDLDHLAGDIGLADLVVGERVVADEVFGVVGRVAHADHPARLLAGLALEYGLEQAGGDVTRQQPLQERARIGLQDEMVAADARGVLGGLDRQ